MTPPKLSKAYLANFKTLMSAFEQGDAALVSAIRKEDQKPVALICAMRADPDLTVLVPFAVMVEGNPFDLFEDPTV